MPRFLSHVGRLTLFIALGLTILLSPIGYAQETELSIRNASFDKWNGDRPASWTIRKNKQKLSQATDIEHETAETALQVELIANGGSSYGEILQKLTPKPTTRYRVSADIRSSKSGIGIIQVKTIRSKKELERLSSDRSSTQWETVSIEFDSANADEVQVLCRYAQKSDFTGESIWWTNLKIEELGSGAPPRDPMSLEVAAPGIDQYVTPDGSGSKDGSSWDNARPAGEQLQAALEAVGPGHTLYLGSGDYGNVNLVLAKGGSGPEARVAIVGTDTGDGMPRFNSTFDKQTPNSGGGVLVKVEGYVGFVTIENLHANAYSAGVVLDGPNRGVRITNVDVTASREGIIVNGGAVAGQPKSGTHDLIIRDSDFTHYTKRGIRLRDGVFDAQVLNCHADAGGEEWATERFAMGFTIEGSKAQGVTDHDIVYEGCTSRNHYDNQGTKYWNADGFAAERSVNNITYRNCGAFDNTDGGWDIKAQNPTFINCVSLRNKRNFRIWSSRNTPATLQNCVAAYSKHPGGTGNRNGLHLANGAGVIVEQCTFIENGQAIDIDGKTDSTWAKVSRSLIYDPQGKAKSTEGKDTTLTMTDSIVVDESTPGSDPEFNDAGPAWEGGNDKFNSQTYPDLGYSHVSDEPA